MNAQLKLFPNQNLQDVWHISFRYPKPSKEWWDNAWPTTKRAMERKLSVIWVETCYGSKNDALRTFRECHRDEGLIIVSIKKVSRVRLKDEYVESERARNLEFERHNAWRDLV